MAAKSRKENRKFGNKKTQKKGNRKENHFQKSFFCFSPTQNFLNFCGFYFLVSFLAHNFSFLLWWSRMLFRLVLVFLFCARWSVGERQYCHPGEDCWPSSDEVQKLVNSLDPSAPRFYYWQGPGYRRVGPTPIFSPNHQPLFGLGEQSMDPLYQPSGDDFNTPCFAPTPSSPPRLSKDSPSLPFGSSSSSFSPSSSSSLYDEMDLSSEISGFYSSDYCRASTRNNPLNGSVPAFVVWPLTVQHIQTLIQFANDHDLCVSVAGTGHDYLNRHSCEDSLFIRMGLFKDIEWVDGDQNHLRIGPGNVFDELQAFAITRNRYIASGWVNTVGIVGWSIGGGHGPFAPSAGLGVDNVVEVEMITAAGDVLVANSQQNTDVYWALRGGGGSTWGIITSITVRTHENPAEGVTTSASVWSGTFCERGPNNLGFFEKLITEYIQWTLDKDTRWGGYAYFITRKSDSTASCGVNWFSWINYVFQGAETDPEFQYALNNLSAIGGIHETNTSHWDSWAQRLEIERVDPIYPVEAWPIIPGDTVGGIPSTTVTREFATNGTLAEYVIGQVMQCKTTGRCGFQQLYQDITGNIGSQQPQNVSISEGMRSDLFHYALDFTTTQKQLQEALRLGRGAYFSESALEMPNYEEVYWGEKNYKTLREIKKKIDPTQRFWCRHCVQ